MQENLKLAVVLPSYNPGPELAWTLDSLRVQTVPFKLFLVDDGSRIKPDYPDLLKGFDDCELIELSQNVGPCTVRNAGLTRALDQGFIYIAQMDTGDWVYPYRLEIQQDFLDVHENVGLVGGGAEILNADKTHAYDFNPMSENDAIMTHLYYGMAFKHPALMYRSSLIRQIGLYSGDYSAAEDYELVRRAARCTAMANVPEKVLKIVEYATGVSAMQRSAQLRSRLRIQWRYRKLSSVHFWLGCGKTLIALVAPVGLIKLLKPVLYKCLSALSAAPGRADGSGS